MDENFRKRISRAASCAACCIIKHDTVYETHTRRPAPDEETSITVFSCHDTVYETHGRRLAPDEETLGATLSKTLLFHISRLAFVSHAFFTFLALASAESIMTAHDAARSANCTTSASGLSLRNVRWK